MKPAKLIIFCALLLAADWSNAYAQTLNSLRDNRTPAAQVSVTFTFPPSGSDYSTFPDEENKERYYIRVASSSLPSYKVSPSTASVRVMVDNEKSDPASLVFWVPVVAGTSPRVDRNQSTLTLTFTPASTSRTSAPATESGGPAAMRALSEPGTPAASLVSSVANPANGSPQATPTPSLASLAPRFKADNNLLAVANVDLAVPESPAFTVLGLTPETVVRPNSPRQFATALLSGVDRNGNFQSGTAIDTVPYLLIAGKELTLKQYRDHYNIRLLSRTQFSFATTKGASDDDKSVRLALGLRLTLWDNGDPRTDKVLHNCFDGVAAKYLEDLGDPPPSLPEEGLPANASEAQIKEAKEVSVALRLKEEQLNTIRLEEIEACRADSRKTNWNKSSWIVAYAPSWISTSGQTKNFKWNGGGFWSSVAYGFEGFPVLAKRSQIIFHGRYRSNEQVPDPAIQGAFLSQDSLFFGTRVRIGNENSTGSFEGVFVRSRHDANEWDTSARYAVGFERRVAENLWFALAFGGENGRANGNNKGFVLTSFRWGFSEKRPLPVPK